MDDEQALEKELENDMLKLYGPVLGGDDLLRVLGYVSKDAFRKSMVRKTVPVPIFKIDNRRGYFSLVKEVARYLSKQRNNAINNKG
jgi:hypothetical protein